MNVRKNFETNNSLQRITNKFIKNVKDRNVSQINKLLPRNKLQENTYNRIIWYLFLSEYTNSTINNIKFLKEIKFINSERINNLFIYKRIKKDDKYSRAVYQDMTSWLIKNNIFSFKDYIQILFHPKIDEIYSEVYTEIIFLTFDKKFKEEFIDTTDLIDEYIKLINIGKYEYASMLLHLMDGNRALLALKTLNSDVFDNYLIWIIDNAYDIRYIITSEKRLDYVNKLKLKPNLSSHTLEMLNLWIDVLQ